MDQAPAGGSVQPDKSSSLAPRWLELLFLFLIAPSLLALFMRGWMVFPAIWALAGLCLLVLWRDPRFDRRELVRISAIRRSAGRLAILALLAAMGLTAVLWVVQPGWLFALPRDRPGLWAIIMLGYPVLSVYPQEIAFRTFFRHRYRALVRSPLAYIALNAVAFGYAHIIMHNAVAVALCVIGGAVLAWNYERTRSTPAAWLEHTLYGCAAFTIGWGPMLYGGAIGR